MARVCKNCGVEVVDKYCGHCGQDFSIKRLDFANFALDTFRFFIFKRGFFYTIKHLTMEPGTSMRDYIKGKRQMHSLPHTFLFTLMTLATFLTIYFKVDASPIAETPNGVVGMVFQGSITMLIRNFFSKYLTISLLGVIPIIAAVAYYIYHRAGFNYTEILISNIYIFSYIVLLYIVLMPLNLLSVNGFYTVFFISGVGYLMWSYLRLFKVGLLSGIRNFIATFLVSYLLYAMLLFLILLIYFVNKNWEQIPH